MEEGNCFSCDLSPLFTPGDAFFLRARCAHVTLDTQPREYYAAEARGVSSMSEYLFGLHSGHLTDEAGQIARRHGACPDHNGPAPDIPISSRAS